MNGIDLSHWNGVVDFSKVGVDFAILKSNQGTNIDSCFGEYYKGCIDNNIKVGAYIYNNVTDISHAIDEARKCLEVIKGKNISMGVWLDLESPLMQNLGKTNLHEIIHAEADLISGEGYKVGIYCNKNWYNNIIKGYELANDFDFWLASVPYEDNGTRLEKINPKTYKGCKIWQYSFKGTVEGIKGYVDLDTVIGELEEIKSPYVKDKTYTLCTDVNVRTAPRKDAPLVGYNGLTADGKKHDINKNGALDKGTIVTCQDVVVHNETWIKCPSGWLCAINGDDIYIY